MVLGPPPTTSQRRSSILPFRPSTSSGVPEPPPPPPPPPPSSSSRSTAPRFSRSSSTDAWTRLAQDINLQRHEVGRWSSVFPAQDRPVIYADATHLPATAATPGPSNGPSLLSFGRSLVRRASTTLNASSKTRKGSKEKIDLPLSSTPPSQQQQQQQLFVQPALLPDRPLTARPDTVVLAPPPQRAASQSKRTSFLRRMKSYRHRRDALSSASGNGASDCSYPHHHPLLPAPVGHQVHPFDWTRPGAAARASAAAAANNMPHVNRPSVLSRKDTKCSRNGAFARPFMAMDYEYAKAESTTEVDSVIGPLDGIDPFTALPPELATIILSYLDHTSLCRASRVSRGWAALASGNNGSLWRQLFMNRFRPRQALPSAPLPMGGAGVGKLDCEPMAWKNKFAARQLIERNWKAGTPSAVYFQGHTDSVYCAQFDEHKIITGSRDRTIRVWDIDTYECLKVIGGPAARPVRPGPNEPVLDCHPNTVHKGVNLNGTEVGDALYHVPTEYHSQSVLCLRFDDEIMVTGSSDATCIVWDIKTWEPIHRLRHHTAGVLDVCFDKRYIISCSKDNMICVWDREGGDLVRVLQGHRGPVNALQMRGSLLISASSDGITKLWNLNTMAHVKDFSSRDRGLAAVEFSDDARWVLAGGNDQVIHKYNVQSSKLEYTYTGHGGLVRSLFLDSENNRVISGSYDQAVRVYEFSSGLPLGGDPGQTPSPTTTSPTSSTGGTGAYENWTTSWILSAKSDYRRIVATSQDGRALLMDFGRGIPDDALNLLKGHA